ncbi:plasmid partitioning protein RepB [Labrys miyagiensis]|uniref:Plasmid partitioning protein RepB n=1 Tax=Labrys miyagiensis TaxID=346912 RepID=A0ABQ6CKF9_9HYPH|nr:plasmid partitioning protein RepB [Labrys miyagiensis]GLS20213.1 plasmid partitioning protein RepB [Labrys miyagiensis]
MSRKGMLQTLLAGRDRELPIGNSSEEEGQGLAVPNARLDVAVPVRAGAVGAMGRALGKIADAAQEARSLIAAGEAVVSLDPTLVEASFITDRIAFSPDEQSALVASIAEHGQQVPILVRPHPVRVGHYQAAYGHRRLQAAAELRKPVRAVVREMSDAELLIAQGQENSARLDLSYIERALFAVAIENHGFDRAAIMAALSVEKTQLSRLIAIGRGIPPEVAQLIGPAAKTGRPRWSALAELLLNRSYKEQVEQLSRDKAFMAADSDARFGLFFAALSGGREASIPFQIWHNEEGREVVRYKQTDGKVTLVMDEKIAPDFGTFLIKHLDQLYERYLTETVQN